MNQQELNQLFEAAKTGTLPAGFTQWDLADDEGTTVAHVAAQYGHLPVDFDQLDLADKTGWTVGQEVVFHAGYF